MYTDFLNIYIFFLFFFFLLSELRLLANFNVVKRNMTLNSLLIRGLCLLYNRSFSAVKVSRLHVSVQQYGGNTNSTVGVGFCAVWRESKTTEDKQESKLETF